MANLLKEYSKELGLGYKILSEINKSDIHDVKPSDNHDDLLNFIDQKIHFATLNVLETPFFIPLLIFEKYDRKIHGKGCDGIGLYNVAEGCIIKSNLSSIIEPYNDTVRNGIAHGNYYYNNVDIEYLDKNNKSVKKRPYEILDMFDDLIDYSNGLYLALITFFITEQVFLQENNIPIPLNILIEEVKYKTKSPLWEVENCLESEGINIGKQINLYAKTFTLDYSTISALAFYSAINIERIMMNIDRIFINIESAIGTGCIVFNAKILGKFRESGYKDFNCLKGYKEDDEIMNYSKKVSPFLFQIELKIANQKVEKELLSEHFRKPFQIRYNRIHIKSIWNIQIVDTKIILNILNVDNVEEYIRLNCKLLINETVRDARENAHFFSFEKYLPVKFIRVLIYNNDFRIRKTNDTENYIASIVYNKSNYIRTFDRNEKVEVLGDYRISWKVKNDFDEL